MITATPEAPRIQGLKNDPTIRAANLLALRAATPVFKEDDVRASICRDEYYSFLVEFWDAFVPDPFYPSPHIKLVCDELQEMAERALAGYPREYDLIINQPPGTSKSSVATVAFPAWLWTRAPGWRTIASSYSAQLALHLGLKSRDIVLSEKYKAHFPYVEIRQDASAKSYFGTTAKGVRISCGAGGTITGMHADTLIVDDPLDPEEAIQSEELKKINRWLTNTFMRRRADKLKSFLVLVMQRLAQNDPSAHLREMRDKNPVRLISLPAELAANVAPLKYRPIYREGLLDPHRLPKSILDADLKVMGAYGYSGQYMQSPIPLGGGMIKVDRIKFESRPKKFKKIVRSWDRAATLQAGCYTAGVKMGLDHLGRFWILDVVREQLDTGARDELMRRVAAADGRGVLIIQEQEPGSGGVDQADNFVKMMRGYRVVTIKPARKDGDKVLRADPYSTQVKAGNVYIPDPAPAWWEDFRGEQRYFPYSKYKDQTDATAAAFNFLNRGGVRVGGVFQRAKRPGETRE